MLFFFTCVSVASFLNGTSEGCFLALRTAVCLSTLLWLKNGEFQGRYFFVCAKAAVQISPCEKGHGGWK